MENDPRAVFERLFGDGATDAQRRARGRTSPRAAPREIGRGRVMGVRILAIYGVPIGLLASGPLIGTLGFANFVGIYVSVGMAVTILIALRWRRALW